MADRLIILTVGTSIAPPNSWKDDPEAYRRAIATRLKELEERSPGRLAVEASAELHTLHRLKADRGDRFLLLATETGDGIVCADVLKEQAERLFGAAGAVQKVTGLQVTDGNRFRRTGIQDLFRRVGQARADHAGLQTILAITGGFKSVVPYCTLYGLLHQVPVVYVFERSETLITLPPAPLSFDWERVGRVRDALLALREQGVVSRADLEPLLKGVSTEDRGWLDTLLEEEDGLATLSPFSSMLVEALDQIQSTVRIGPAARAAFEASSGLTRSQFVSLLGKVGDPTWRSGKIHAFPSTDLTIIKPGNVAERMGCILKGSTVFVAELWGSHDQYEREAPAKKASLYRLADFTDWVRPATEPEPPSTDHEQHHLLVESYRRLQSRLMSVETGLAEMGDRLRQREDDLLAAEERSERLQAERGAIMADKDRLAGELAGRESELELARAELEQWKRVRRPWWRRWFGGA